MIQLSEASTHPTRAQRNGRDNSNIVCLACYRRASSAEIRSANGRARRGRVLHNPRELGEGSATILPFRQNTPVSLEVCNDR